ncbi:hypothetical protein AGMMS4952_25140 [Spirochaetia bacterium]|nr:hypothetical protein AGMMS4952_25140 [Spirochaetia bacterium]
MKKLAALVLVIPVLFMAACGGGSSGSSSSSGSGSKSATAVRSGGSGVYKIGIATREITNDYNRDIISGARKVIEDAGGSVTITDANADFQKHNENIENLINSGVDGLIVQLGDAQQLAPIMARAKAKGIPVVTAGVGAPVPDTLTDINGDNPILSILASDALLSAVGYKGDIYIVWVPGAPLLETRKRIFEAVCKDHPGLPCG